MTWNMEHWYDKNIHVRLYKLGMDRAMLATMRNVFDFASLQSAYVNLQDKADIRERRKARHVCKEIMNKVMASARKRHKSAGRDLSGMPDIVAGARKAMLVALEPREA